MKIVAYDLDGVLAEGPPVSVKKWGLMKGPERAARKSELLYWYSRAKVLFNPPEQLFHVITARKADPSVRDTTYLWLRKHFPNRVIRVHHLNVSRSVENVIAFKSSALKEIKASEFTEDNLAVVKGVRKALPSVHTWLFKDGLKYADPSKNLQI